MLVEGALIFFIVRYRRGRRARTADGAQVHGNTRLELGWTIVPVLIVGVIIGYVFASLPDVTDVPKASAANTVDVRVEAHQYYFRFLYPGGQVSIDQMVVPVDAVVNQTVSPWTSSTAGGCRQLEPTDRRHPGPHQPHVVPAQTRPASTPRAARSSAGCSTRRCRPR